MDTVKKAQWAALVALVVIVGVLLAVLAVQRADQRADAEEAGRAYSAIQGQRQAEAEAQKAKDQEAARQKAEAELESNSAAVKSLVSSDEDLTISVLGDSTGDGPDEWVFLWAESLAEDGATVTVHQWNGQAGEWRDSPTVFGDGGRAVTIWNGSHPGASAAYALAQSDLLQPEKPDLLITNYGHNGTAAALKTELGHLLDRTSERWDGPVPSLLTIQNPATGDAAKQSAANQEAVAQVAASRNLPTLDVRPGFEAADNLNALLLDDGAGVHPNADGSQLWVEAVSTFFG